ncbi:dienelactone hydrolase family protein [Streptomyces sp. NPDC052644]
MEIMLFHSAYGLRPAVHAAADRLRAAGHQVHVPDLYEGQTAGSAEEAMALRDRIGWEESARRAVAAAAPHSDRGLVYAGISLGAALAQTLAVADEKARGLLLLHGTYEVPESASVDGLPVQLHVADPDPFEPDDWLNTWYLELGRAGAEIEVHRYRGAGHLYTDPELDDYDAEAAELTWAASLEFLAGL